jgi:hypothetical protein
MCLIDCLIMFILLRNKRESQGVPPTSYYLIKRPFIIIINSSPKLKVS